MSRTRNLYSFRKKRSYPQSKQSILKRTPANRKHTSALPLLSTITPPTYHQTSPYTHSSPPTIDKPDRTLKYTQSSLGKLSQLRQTQL